MTGPSSTGPATALYGLDIETDTSVNGLDPSVAAVTAVAVASADGPVVFTGAEHRVLADLAKWLSDPSVLPGVVVTWNGSAFDLPFLASRAAHNGISLALQLRPDPAFPLKYPPAVGWPHAVRATIGPHGHCDLMPLWRPWAAEHNISAGLKAVAAAVGIEMIEVDRTRIHALTAGELADYVASDAVGTLALARRSGPLPVDSVPSSAW